MLPRPSNALVLSFFVLSACGGGAHAPSNAPNPGSGTAPTGPASGAPLVQDSHRAIIRRIELSPDGARLATASDDGTVKLWSSASKTLLRTIRPAFKSPPSFVAWRDASHVVYGSSVDRPLVLDIDADTKTALAGSDSDLPRDTSVPAVDGAEASARSHDGKLTFIASGSGMLVRDAATKRELCAVKTDGRARASLAAFTPDDRFLVVHTAPQLVVVDAKTCAISWVTNTLGVSSLAFDGRGNVIAGDVSGTATLRDIESGRLRGFLGTPLRLARQVTFPADDLVVVQGLDTVMGSATMGFRETIWSLKEGRIVHGETAKAEHTIANAGQDLIVAEKPSAPACDESFSEPLIFSAVDDLEGMGAARGPRQKPVRSTTTWPPRPGVPLTLCVDPFHTTRRWLDAERGILVTKSSPNGDSLLAVDLRSDRRSVLEGSTGSALDLQLRAGRAACVNPGRLAPGKFAPEMVARVWSLETGKLVRELAQAEAVALSADGKLAAIARERELIVYGVDDGKERTRITLSNVVRSLAFGATSADLVVSTSQAELLAYHEGRLVGSTTLADELPASLVMSPNGERFVTLVGGRVRVWRSKDATLLAELFELADGEFAILTPEGHYTGSADVGQHLGWSFTSPLDAVSLDRLPVLASRPKVLERLRGNPSGPAPYIERPPHVDIIGLTPQGNSASIRVGGVAANIRAFVNGRAVAEAKPTGDRTDLLVPLRPGLNRVTVVGFTASGLASNEISRDILHQRPVGEKADLWVLGIGVSEYPNLSEDQQLPGAFHDAKEIGATFAAYAGRPELPFARAHQKVLVNGEVTPESVRAAVKELEAMNENDVAVVLFAGHGLKPTPDEDMRFITGSINVRDRSTLATSSIGWNEIGASLARARGRVVVLLDACHSGDFTRAQGGGQNEELAASLGRENRSGFVVFAAAKGRQVSYEPRSARGLVLEGTAAEALGTRRATPVTHGFFTAALLTALKDASSDHDRDGKLQLGEIIDEVIQRVSVASDMRQTPWLARRDFFGDFDVVPAAPKRP